MVSVCASNDFSANSGYLRFVNGQHHYIVYTAIGKGWGERDGVAVEKNGQRIANLECRDAPLSKLSEEFFSHANLPADRDEFQIPGLD